MSLLALKAHAKINWSLLVTGKRSDGYHSIRSLIQCLSLHDTLTFEESGTIDVITDADIELKKNLVYRAAHLLRKASGIRKGARIKLSKNIPIAAGLGGGSSNAACTLKGLIKLWDINMPDTDISSLAASLGSDVPFFMNGPSALVEGRGENVSPVTINTACTIVLAKPHFGVSAAEAYSGVRNTSASDNTIELLLSALSEQDYESLSSLVRNDLEKPVFKTYPAIKEIKDRMLQSGAVVSAMSGSGSTVFGVFRNRQEGTRAIASFQPLWSVTAETLI
jgi:4-diphosphocytidyl-2-C-methyl-D-erythritol kinase